MAEQARLTLHIPRLDELDYRQRLMQDPHTMSYNKGYDLAFAGYHRDTGCIDFPPSEWAGWHAYFVGQEPKRFYAYVMRLEDGAFLGEVNVHQSGDHPWYEMGIVLEAKYRGQGYADEALRLLLSHAFQALHAQAVHNDFEESRTAALRAHLNAGFVQTGTKNGIAELLLTRERWIQKNRV